LVVEDKPTEIFMHVWQRIGHVTTKMRSQPERNPIHTLAWVWVVGIMVSRVSMQGLGCGYIIFKWLAGIVSRIGLGVGLGCSRVCPSGRYVRGSGIIKVAIK
jgi:hypothetical protein